jgi:enoyl-CoA hydratase/carnithine racemase
MVREGYRGNIHKALRALYALDLPLIAAVNGPAIGLGCDIACLADIRLASTNAKFGVTFLKLGIVPGDGGAWILPRVIGLSRASELFYTGRVIDAATAEAWGLVSRVVAPEALIDEALALAGEIAAQPPYPLRATKMMLRQGQTLTYDAMLELAASTQGLMHHTQDHREGAAAVLERRPPKFTGA